LIVIPFIILILIAPRLFLHGGASLNPTDKKLKSQGDLYFFDIESQAWKKFFVFDQPAARDMHTLTKVGSMFYIYGG
jgi:Kelch motif